MGTITPNGTPLNVQIYAIFLKDRAFTLFLLKGSRFARTCAPPFARTCALTVRVFKAPNATSNERRVLRRASRQKLTDRSVLVLSESLYLGQGHGISRRGTRRPH